MKTIFKGLWSLLKLLLVAIGMLVLYIIAIMATNGMGGGLIAGLLALAIYGYLAWYYRFSGKLKLKKINWQFILITVILSFFVIYTLIPVVDSKTPPHYKDFPGISTQYWKMKTGSTLAVYKIPADSSVSKKPTPIIFLHGGPGAYVRQLDVNFFRSFARDGYDVYLYDQAGSGRSSLLPKDQYAQQRNLDDLNAMMDRIHAGKYVVVGQSYGGALLAHAVAQPRIARRIEKAIFTEPGTCMATKDKQVFSKHPNALQEEVNVPLRIFLSWIVNPKGHFTSQNEVINFFVSHPLLIQNQFRESFPIKDRLRVPRVEPNIINFSVVSILTREIPGFNPNLEKDLHRVKVPSMLMLGESSYVERNAPMDLLRINPNIQRVQYFRGVGHILWNGLDSNNAKVKQSIDEFLNSMPASISNYPLKKDINNFLALGQ